MVTPAERLDELFGAVKRLIHAANDVVNNAVRDEPHSWESRDVTFTMSRDDFERLRLAIKSLERKANE